MMGTLRAALHAYALEMHEPSVVLDRLNVVLMQAGARMASVLYAIIDAEEGIVRFASAGHPPLLLIDPQGNVSFLRLGRSPLLGHEYPRERPQAIASLEPGSTLMMYTDGVLEGGCNSVDEALDRLAASVSGAVGVDPQSLCTRVLPGSEPREDDAALLVCRLDGMGKADSASSSRPTQPSLRSCAARLEGGSSGSASGATKAFSCCSPRTKPPATPSSMRTGSNPGALRSALLRRTTSSQSG